VTTLVPGALIVKEGRALAPIWLGAVVTIIAATQAGMLEGALLAFIFGAAALGVLSIGHEYGNRTLTSLLAQPLSRSRLLLSKVVVLAPLLVLLSLVVAFVLFRADGIERMFGGVARTPGGSIYTLAAGRADAALVSRWQLTIVVLTPLLGLCVGPWLTMVFRNATAGLVFTLAVPASLWIAGQVARAASVDFDFVELEVGSPFGYEPVLVLMIIGVLAVSLVAAVHGRALFVGLEALDSPRNLLPSTLKRRPVGGATDLASQRRGSRPHGPLLLFVRKEARLHGLAFAVAGLYAISWIALWLARADTYLADDSFELLASMYGLFIALLIGAISVAEERALGTADMQTLLPWPYWKLCLVKLAAVSLIALVLAMAVPTGFEAALPLIGGSAWTVGPTWDYFRFYLPSLLSNAGGTILLTTLFSCYVSSMCVGGLRALFVALPSSFVLASLHAGVLVGLGRLENAVTTHLYGPGLPCVPGGSIERCQRPWWAGRPTVDFNTDFGPPYTYSRWMTTIALIGFVALILFLYQRNFRSGEHGASMAKKQLPWVAVYVALAAVLIGGGEALLRVWLLTH
jgi:ABC-type transport system involved in multi-copper enzyme maturation permease subunit